MLQTREIPYSSDAEIGVLACAIHSEEAQAIVLETLKAIEFHIPANRMIFTAISRLYQRNSAIDVLTVSSELETMGVFEDAGGIPYIAMLVDAVPGFENAEHYCNIVHDKAVARKLIIAAKEIVDAAYGDIDLQELLDAAEGKIFNVSTDVRRTTIMDMDSLVWETMDEIEQRIRSEEKIFGVRSGLPKLDNLTTGYKRGTLNVIAGRPSMGKTALAINIAQYAAITHGTRSMIFSLEMSNIELIFRMLASQATVDVRDLTMGQLTTEEHEAVSKAAGILSNAPIFIDDQPFTTPLEIRAKSRRVAKEHGLDMIIIDYLQLMGMPNHKGTREQEISTISRFLKGLAKEMDIPVLAVSQLSRACEQREDKRPILSDLRESGAIEQDADTVLFVFREEIYTGAMSGDRDVDGQAELLLAKQRNGPIGKVTLRFFKEQTKFGDLI